MLITLIIIFITQQLSSLSSSKWINIIILWSMGLPSRGRCWSRVSPRSIVKDVAFPPHITRSSFTFWSASSSNKYAPPPRRIRASVCYNRYAPPLQWIRASVFLTNSLRASPAPDTCLCALQQIRASIAVDTCLSSKETGPVVPVNRCDIDYKVIDSQLNPPCYHPIPA